MNFPKRPPTQILLSPKRQTQLLLARQQSRVTINPNTIISQEDPLICQQFFNRRGRKREIKRAEIKDIDADYISYLSKKLKDDKQLITNNLSDLQVMQRFPAMCDAGDRIQELAQMRGHSNVQDRNAVSQLAKKQENSWVNRVNTVESDFYVFLDYNKQYNQIIEQGKEQKSRLLNIRSEKSSSPSAQHLASQNKYRAFGTGNICKFCKQRICLKDQPQRYDIGNSICVGCGQYIKEDK